MLKGRRFIFNAGLAVIFLVYSQALLESAYLEPWVSNTQAGDVAKSTSVEITSGFYQYTVNQGGYMDGDNCRTPYPWMTTSASIIWQTWESNRQVKMENTGTNDLVNPWLSNGRNSFRNAQEIVDAALLPGMTAREKVLALWYQNVLYRYHKVEAAGSGNDDPVRLYNCYGHNTCASNAQVLAALWLQAGITPCHPSHFVGHTVSETFFDGRYNFLDGDMQSVMYLRDNHTIANEYELTRDRDLARRSHQWGLLYPDNRLDQDEAYMSQFVYDGPPALTIGALSTKTMNMTLRPNEAITWRWGVLTTGTSKEAYKYRGVSTSVPPRNFAICNGLWEYRPDFTNDSLWRCGTYIAPSSTGAVNIVNTGGVLTATPGQTGTIIWKISSPYVIVGGSITTVNAGAVFKLSFENFTWTPPSAWTTITGTNLDSFFPVQGATVARYEYFLKCELTGSASLSSLTITNDIEMAPLAMPRMSIGANTFTYTDNSTGTHNVRITHEWVERSVNRPPNAPPSPVYPADGGESDGTNIVFSWAAPTDPDGDTIADYHFQLSERPDMKWPLSFNFNKIICYTNDAGQARYTVPYTGLLTPDRTYYWRVKAKDKINVKTANTASAWSAWSNTWSFTARGPAVPVNVVMDTTTTGGLTGILKWAPDTIGRAPVKYRIYGSNEQGFMVSDSTYTAYLGIETRITNPIPSNFACDS